MGKKYELSHLVNEARTGAGKRALSARLPQIIEPPKTVLLLRGHATSSVGTALLTELHMLKKPYGKKLQRTNDVMPFESGGEAHLENLCRLNDCSLFSLVNHSKKRPHNVIFGRTFAHRILDMVEFGVTQFMPSAGFPSLKSAPASSPLLIFNGDDYETSETTKLLRSLLLDMFHGPDDVKMLNLAGIDRVVVFTLCGEKKVLFRQYAIEMKRDKDSSLPLPALTEVGPKFDLEVRRVQTGAEGMMKDAMKKPQDPTKPYKRKNVARDDMGDKMGRIHVGRQDLSSLALARMKGLGKKRKSGDLNDLKDDSDSNGEEGDAKLEESVDGSASDDGDDDDSALDNEAAKEGPLKKAKVASKT